MINPLVFFILSFLIIYTVVRKSAELRSVITAFGQYLQRRAFPSYSGLEYYKFAVLRILFGLILLLRAIDIHRYLTPEDLYSSVGVWSILSLAAATFITIGLLTQYSFLFLVFLMWHYGESVLGTGTLGNDVGAMLSVVLFLTGSGRYMSIDALIINRFHLLEKMFLYVGEYADTNIIALIKFSALISYWAVCVYSLSMHLNEPAWMTGVAGPLLLTNNFMSSWCHFFESVFITSELAVHIAKYLLWIMMFWYMAILPLTLLGGLWRSYVIVWGLLFFTLSLTVLNLGSLAEIEFIFWAAIFWSRAGIDSSVRLSVLYDDKCNLCDKTVQVISALDIFGRIRLKPISHNHDFLEKHEIHLKDALYDLYGVLDKSESIAFGYDFYVLLSRKIVLLWPVFPILILAKLLYIGPLMYRFIAARRQRLFGACILSSPKIERQVQPVTSKEQYFSLSVVMHITFLACCYLIAMPAPYLGKAGFANAANQAAHIYGIAPINVFNRTDLRMAENWFTLTSVDYRELLPLLTKSGKRMDMHNSDRVYFGNTLKFRRSAIGRNGCVSELARLEYLANVYLARKSAQDGVYYFIYDQYYQPLPDTDELMRGHYKKSKIEKKCSLKYRVDYES